MTAVDVDALDKLRDEFAELVWGVLVAAGMRDGTRAPSPSVIAHAIVGNLLPVVDRIANERAAAALELAGVLTVPSQDTSEEVREALFRRADALRASNGEAS